MTGKRSADSDRLLIDILLPNAQSKANPMHQRAPVKAQVILFIGLLVVTKGLIQLMFGLYVIIGGEYIGS